MVAGPHQPQENEHNGQRPEPRDGRRAEGMGPLPVHGSGSSAAMPNLAAAQIPGPGTAHILAGETAAVPDDAADPFEKQGHEHAHREPGRRHHRWPWRLFKRH